MEVRTHQMTIHNGEAAVYFKIGIHRIVLSRK